MTKVFLFVMIMFSNGDAVSYSVDQESMDKCNETAGIQLQVHEEAAIAKFPKKGVVVIGACYKVTPKGGRPA